MAKTTRKSSTSTTSFNSSLALPSQMSLDESQWKHYGKSESLSDSEFPSEESSSWEELGLRHTRYAFPPRFTHCPECGEELSRVYATPKQRHCRNGLAERDQVRYQRAWKIVPWLLDGLLTLPASERYDYIQAFRAWAIRAGNRYIMDAVAEHLTEEEL